MASGVALADGSVTFGVVPDPPTEVSGLAPALTGGVVVSGVALIRRRGCLRYGGCAGGLSLQCSEIGVFNLDLLAQQLDDLIGLREFTVKLD